MDPRANASRTVTLHKVAETSAATILTHARELRLESARFVIVQPGAARFCFGSLEQEAARLPLSYIEQGGGCLIANAQGKPAGFVAWRALPAAVEPHAWELKRLWVRPAARG